jgi:DNA topoisomerase-1
VSTLAREPMTPAAAGLTDEVETAREAGLRYVTDDRPGITRHRAGKGFSYRDAFGERITSRLEIARFRSIVIPPAWTSVWICPNPRGHIQATGRDARGRKQYRYHPAWRAIRDASKFDRVLGFGEALPRLRARIEDDLRLPGVPRERVLATVISMIDQTLMRVGNEEYARTNDSYGATTLRGDHVEVQGADVEVTYRGKHGKEHQVKFHDPRTAAVIKRCQDLPGECLFSYLDESGEPRRVESGDVNDYLREIAGSGFTVKDFRTFGGTVLCYRMLVDAGEPTSANEAASTITGVIKLVAARLGNTPAVCRSSYVHPTVLTAYAEGTLETRAAEQGDPIDHLSGDELRCLAFLGGREPLLS